MNSEKADPVAQRETKLAPQERIVKTCLSRQAPQMMKTFKAFVFDFDGTLAELNLDFTFMKDCLVALSREYGIEGDGLKDLLYRKDPRKAVSFSYAAYRRIEEIEIEAARKGSLLEGTLLLLTTLKERRNAVAVITRNCSAALKSVFPQIEDYCNVLLSRDKTTHVKPHPDHLIKALHILDASPEFA